MQTIPVEGGTIAEVEPYHTHEDGRPLRHRIHAVSDHEGKAATFMCEPAARHWLGIINERVLMRRLRLGQ